MLRRAASSAAAAAAFSRHNEDHHDSGSSMAAEHQSMMQQSRQVDVVEKKSRNGRRLTFSIRCRSPPPPLPPTPAYLHPSAMGQAPAAPAATMLDVHPALTAIVPPPLPSSSAVHTSMLRSAAVTTSPLSVAAVKLPDELEAEAVLPMPVSEREVVKRIILIRSGESDSQSRTLDVTTPDWKIPLLPRGVAACEETGSSLARLVGEEPMYVFHSPFQRARESMEAVQRGFTEELQRRSAEEVHEGGRRAAPRASSMNLIGIREDARLRGEDLGRYRSQEEFQYHLEQRQLYGEFFYRFPHGESGADVCDRVTGFLESIRRFRSVESMPANTNIVIFTHDSVIRMFLKRWFHLNVETFHLMSPLPSASMASTLTRVPNRPIFRLNEECIELMKLPVSLNEKNGYSFRNKQFLGSISSGAPFM